MLHTWLVNLTSLGLSFYTHKLGTTIKWESIRERKKVQALAPGLLETFLKCCIDQGLLEQERTPSFLGPKTCLPITSTLSRN